MAENQGNIIYPPINENMNNQYMNNQNLIDQNMNNQYMMNQNMMNQNMMNQNMINQNMMNQNMINQNMINQNVAYAPNINEDYPCLKVLRGICLIVLGLLILIEIILEISSFSDYDEETSHIVWTEEEKEHDDTGDFTLLSYFFLTLFSNAISMSILCSTCFDKNPIIKIIVFAILLAIKEILVTKIKNCCDYNIKRHIDCEDVFNDKINGVIVTNVIFGLIAISYQVSLKIVAKIPN